MSMKICFYTIQFVYTKGRELAVQVFWDRIWFDKEYDKNINNT